VNIIHRDRVLREVEMRPMRVLAAVTAAIAMVLAGCPEDIEGNSGSLWIGADCTESVQCASGVCEAGVCAPPALPVADAGRYRIGVVGLPVQLDGTQSSDPQGRPLVFSWRVLTGPNGSAATLADEGTGQPSLTADLPGPYELELSVSAGNDTVTDKAIAFVFGVDGGYPKQPDGTPCTEGFECQSGNCSDSVCSSNFRPEAAVGPAVEVPIAEVFTIDASGSSDPDGDTLTYTYALVQVPENSTAVLEGSGDDNPIRTLTPDEFGTYVVQVWVGDGFLLSDPATKIIVAGINDPPQDRPDGADCDENKQCASGFCDANICKANEVPQADAGPIQYVEVGEVATVSGVNSFDAEGAPLEYRWSLFQRPAASAAELDTGGLDTVPTDAVDVTFTPDVAGVYLVRLVVFDGVHESLSALATIAAGVSEPLLPTSDPCTEDIQCATGKCGGSGCALNIAPIAEAGPEQVVAAGATVTLDGSGSSDPDGDTLTEYTWTLVSTPPGADDTFADADASDPTASFTTSLPGPYVFELVVADGYTTSVPDHVLLSVGITGVKKPDGEPCTQDDECQSGICSTTCSANGAPVAEAGPTQFVTVDDVVTLDGSGSTDPDSDPLGYAWTLVQTAPGSTASLTGADTAAPTFTADAAGVYAFELAVDDGALTSTPDLVVVVAGVDAPPTNTGGGCTLDSDCVSGVCNAGVCEPNQPPVADPGLVQVVAAPAVVNLDGSASSDPDGDALTWAWSFVDVPVGSAASFDDVTSTTPSFYADLPGFYVIRLTVSDGALTSEATLSIVATDTSGVAPVGEPCILDSECASGWCNNGACAINLPPSVVVPGAQQVELNTTGIVMDTAGSVDPEGQPITYLWQVFDPTGAEVVSTPTPTATFDATVLGTYVARATLSDGYNLVVGTTAVVVTETTATKLPDGDPCSSDTECLSGVCATTCQANTAPTADLVTTGDTRVGALQTFDGSGSSDPDNDTLTYVWTVLDAPAASAEVLADNGVNATLRPDAPGQYVVMLQVTDGALYSPPVVSEVEIAPNAPPTAALTFDDSGSPVVFDASGSSDPDGDSLVYTWELLYSPGNSGTLVDNGTSADLTATQAGPHLVRVRVSDGAFEDTALTVYTPVIGNPPVADIAVQGTAAAGCTFSVDGAGSSDTDGTVVGWSWSLTSVPAGSSTAQLVSPNATSTVFDADVQGDYEVTLVVTDDAGNTSAPMTMTVTVGQPFMALDLADQLTPGAATLFVSQGGAKRRVRVTGDPGWVVTMVEESPNTVLWNTVAAPDGSAYGDSAMRFVPGEGLYYASPFDQSTNALVLPECADEGQVYATAVPGGPSGDILITMEPMQAMGPLAAIPPALTFAQSDLRVVRESRTFPGLPGFPAPPPSVRFITTDGRVWPLGVSNDNGDLVEQAAYSNVDTVSGPWGQPPFVPVVFEYTSAVIDGQDTDWQGAMPVWSDLAGDTVGSGGEGTDIGTIHFVADATHVYFHIELLDGPPAPGNDYVIGIYTPTGDYDLEFYVDDPIVPGPGTVLVDQNDPSTGWTSLAETVDFALTPSGMEFRVARSAGLAGGTLETIIDGARLYADACSLNVCTDDQTAPTFLLQGALP